MTPEEARKQLRHLVSHAQFSDAEKLARQVRDDAIRANDQQLATDAAFILGQCCLEQLHHQDAWDAFADTVADCSELYGPNHLRTAQARAWLAAASLAIGRQSDASSLIQRAKATVAAQPSEAEWLIAADALKAIGYVQTRLNEVNAARDTLHRSLHMMEMASDATELDVADVCVMFGMAEQMAKQFDNAERLYQRALDIRLPRLGESNELVKYCRNHLGVVKMLKGGAADGGELSSASMGADLGLSQMGPRAPIAAVEEDHAKAVDTLERALLASDGPDGETPEVAQTLIMLGLMQMGFEQPELAEPHLRRAVKILLPYHQTHLETLFSAFNNTLAALNQQRKFKDVVKFAEPILEALQNEPLVDTGFLASVVAGISSGYYGMKKFAKAEKLLRRAVGIIESRLGPDARELEPILHNLSRLLDEMGRKMEARTFAKRRDEILAKYA